MLRDFMIDKACWVGHAAASVVPAHLPAVIPCSLAHAFL